MLAHNAFRFPSLRGMVKLDRKFASDARRRNANNTRVYEFCDNAADDVKLRSNLPTKCVMPDYEKASKQ